MKTLNNATQATIPRHWVRHAALHLLLIVGLGASGLGAAPADALLSAAELDAAHAWFSAYPGQDSMPALFLEQGAPLAQAQVQGLHQPLWRAYQKSTRARELAALLPDPFMIKAGDTPAPQACRLTTGDKIMPFYFVGKGDLPEKRPLFIALHGGGSAGGRAPSAHGWSVNSREWQAQLRLCAQVYPDNALYFIPRMADDNDGRWYYHYCQDAYEQVVRAGILHHKVDPNRVYLIGISEGAYTAYRMGAFMADRWAGAGSMAGGEPLGNAPPENMRNLAFCADIGENDTRYDRIGLNQRYGQALQALKDGDPQGFTYRINVQAGRGHGIDYEPCPQWIYQHQRNPWPKRVSWTVIKVHGRRKAQCYWLALDQDPHVWPLYIDARIQARDNSVIISMESDGENGQRVPVNDAALRVYLNDHLLDLDKAVRVICNGKQVFQGVVPRQVGVMMKSLAERADPSYVFPAQVVLSGHTDTEESGSEAKLLQVLPEPYGRFVTRSLKRAGPNREQVARALLAAPEGQRSVAFTLLSLLPEAQLCTIGQKDLTQEISTMAPVLLQEPDRRQQRALAAKLLAAGANMPELLKMLQSCRPDHQKAAIFLISHMPEHDLVSLTGAFLKENIELAYQGWKQSPWHDRIPEQLFLQYILPYAHLNERRDNWRGDFMRRLQDKAWSYASPMDATIWLNNELNDLFKVYFHATKRPKADQSPYESIEAGYASCTGLSVLLADACRSVGIPARLVGIPQWTEVRGNHNWVEVWDGQWHNVGGTGSDPRDDDWVNQRCLTQTDPDQWRHTVYAASFRTGNLHFPLVWDASIHYVPALNVTRFYSHRQTTQIDIPEPGPASVAVYWAGEIIACTRGEGQVSLTLARGNTYQIHITTNNGKTHQQILRL
jgi:hypothetical protein